MKKTYDVQVLAWRTFRVEVDDAQLFEGEKCEAAAEEEATDLFYDINAKDIDRDLSIESIKEVTP